MAAEREITLVARLVDNVSKVLKNMGDNVNKQTKRMKTSFKEMGKSILNMRSLLAGAGVVAFFQKTVGAAGKFEAQMREVATLSEEMSDNIGQFSKEVLELSTRSGQGLDTLTKSLFDAVSAGIPAGQAMEFLSTATELAIGGATETSIAVDGLTTVINAFSLDASQATDVSDAFFTAMKFGKTTVAELASSIGPLAPTARAAGLSFDEMLGGVSALTKAGFNTANAVTAMQGALVGINALTPEAIAQMESQGLAYKVTGEEGETFIDVLNNITKAGGGTLEGVKALVPNINGVKGILALASEEGKNFREVMGLMGKRAGETAKAYSKMSNTFEFKSQQIKQGFQTAFIEVGNQLMPFFKKMAEGILENMDNIKFGIALAGGVITDVFNMLQVGIQTVLAVVVTAAEGIRAAFNAITLMAADVARDIVGFIDKLPGSIVPEEWKKSIDDFRNTQIEDLKSGADNVQAAWTAVAEVATEMNEEGFATVKVFQDMGGAIEGAATSMKDLTEKEKELLGIQQENNDKRGAMTEEQLEKIKAFNDQVAQLNEDFLNRTTFGQIEVLEKQRDDLLAFEGATAEQREQIRREFALRIADIEKQAGEDVLRQNEQFARKDAALQKERLKARQKTTDMSIKATGEVLKAVKASGPVMKAFAMSEAGVNASRAFMQALASGPPPLNMIQAGLVAAMGATQIANIARQSFATGGFPVGANANIRVNERGQEAILNAQAVNRVGIGGVNSLNNGTPSSVTVTNEIVYNPSIAMTQDEETNIVEVLERDKQAFAEFFMGLDKRGYFQGAVT